MTFIPRIQFPFFSEDTIDSRDNKGLCLDLQVFGQKLIAETLFYIVTLSRPKNRLSNEP